MGVKKMQFPVAVGAALALSVALSACNPAAQRGPEPGASQGASQGAVSPRSSAAPSRPAASIPTTRSGKSRSDYAAQQLSGVTIQQDTTGFDAQKFAAQAAAGRVPDLQQVDRSVVSTLADKDLIIPIDECYTLYGVTPDQQYYPSTIADVTYDGKVYAVPQFFQPSALIANKRVLSAAGVTPEQLDTSKPDQHRGPGQEDVRREGRQADGDRLRPRPARVGVHLVHRLRRPDQRRDRQARPSTIRRTSRR